MAKLYVGNLPYTITDQQLLELFSQAGAVSSASVITDRQSGRSKGFGFVEYASDEDSNKAIEMFNNYNYEGRALTVNVARPQTERPPRTGGGGGFRGGSDWNDRGGRSGGRGFSRDRY